MTSATRIPSITRYTRFLALLFTILVLSGCGGGDSDTPYASSPEMDRAVVDVRTSLENALGKAVPSLSVLVQTPAGVYFSGSSAPGVRPVTPGTYFRFASNTKNFTAAAILKMHQDGWLNYDVVALNGQPTLKRASACPCGPSMTAPWVSRTKMAILWTHMVWY